MSDPVDVVAAQRAQVVVPAAHDVTLVDLLDRIIERGVVIKGDVVLSVAGVDLIHLGLQLSLTGIDAVPGE